MLLAAGMRDLKVAVLNNFIDKDFELSAACREWKEKGVSDMARALQGLGFNVVEELCLDGKREEAALRAKFVDFAKKYPAQPVILPPNFLEIINAGDPVATIARFKAYRCEMLRAVHADLTAHEKDLTNMTCVNAGVECTSACTGHVHSIDHTCARCEVKLCSDNQNPPPPGTFTNAGLSMGSGLGLAGFVVDIASMLFGRSKTCKTCWTDVECVKAFASWHNDCQARCQETADAAAAACVTQRESFREDLKIRREQVAQSMANCEI